MARYPLNMPVQLKKDAEQWAENQGVSLNQFVLWAVSEKVGALKQQLDDPAFPRITYRRGGSGTIQPVLRGSGIRVQTIVTAHREWRLAEEEIAAEYGLTKAQVAEALAFFEAHRQEIEAHMRLEARLAAEANG
ncbi:MAG TPA: DUF433 domain-containing protein [Anaerolineae bacterium]|nr:DUF433 domain-containing protein [Anaerolineae bacterium]